MFVKLKTLSAIFFKSAQNILPPGQHTITPEMAKQIGKQALEVFEKIDRYVLMNYAHQNFKNVVKSLSDGNIPDVGSIASAVQEYKSGLKHFMPDVPVENLLYIM